jgi:hypothetical protein
MSKRWTLLASPRKVVVSLALLVGSLLAVGAIPAGAGAAGTPPTLTLTLSSSSVAVSGSTVSGAVNVAVTSAKGMKEPSPVLIRLNPGVSIAEAEALIKSKKIQDPNNVSKVGSIVFDIEGAPGATTEGQTELQPGSYLALNVEGQSPSNPPRAAFTVTAAPSPAVLPTAQASERTIEFAFKGPTVLHVGEVVRFENEGFLVHMDIAFPVKSRKAALKAAHDLKIGNEKAAGKLISGRPFSFFGPLSPGGFQQTTISAKPGWYVQACFMDTQDGRQHTQLGMERVIKIVK